MDWTLARRRFAFLAAALEGSGGFCPTVTWSSQQVVDKTGAITGAISVPSLSGATELVRYPRESDAKFAARNAVAVYENHLSAAVERYIGFLGRKRPQREGIDAPLVQLLIENADLRGTPLDDWLLDFARQCKARGSMLLVIDTPTGAPATSLADQVARRRVPYLRTAAPESVKEYRLDPDSGLFLRVTLTAREFWSDEEVEVERDYTVDGWRVRKAGTQEVLAEGQHAFGACQVLCMTETGGVFPVVGEYAQVADLSRRVFNARSERDEILRSQTFSLLNLVVPPDAWSTFDAASAAAHIGTHSMLVSPAQAAFIAPDSGPAEVYAANIEELTQAIRRISREETTEQGAQAESGVARRLRFEALNASLATFARQLQQLEARVWAMFKRAAGSGDVSVSWPTDFNLADVLAELDVLTAMQMAGMPPAVLNEKRRAIVATEFDALDDDTKAQLLRAIDEYEQEAAAAGAVAPGQGGEGES